MYIEHESLKAACSTTDTEISDLQNENHRLATDLKRYLSEDSTEISDLTFKNDKLLEDVKKSKDTDNCNQSTIVSLQDDNKILGYNITSFQRQLSAETSTVSTLTSQLTSLQATISTLTTMPNTPPTPLQQSTSGSNIPPNPNPDDVPVTKSHLRELYSQDERKSIPVYKGKRGEQLINN